MKNDTEKSTSPNVKEFPAGLPPPHLARDWARSVEAALTAKGLTDVARSEVSKSSLMINA